MNRKRERRKRERVGRILALRGHKKRKGREGKMAG